MPDERDPVYLRLSPVAVETFTNTSTQGRWEVASLRSPTGQIKRKIAAPSLNNASTNGTMMNDGRTIMYLHITRENVPATQVRRINNNNNDSTRSSLIARRDLQTRSNSPRQLRHLPGFGTTHGRDYGNHDHVKQYTGAVIRLCIPDAW